MKDIIKTERLVLRKPEIRDADEITACMDADVVKFLAKIPWPYEKKHAIDYIEQSQRQFGVESFCFVIEFQGKIIGTVALKKIKKQPDLGYWVAKDHWGKGIATEAAKAMIKFGFDDLKLDRIIAFTDVENTGSYKVQEKIGMKRVELIKNEYKDRFGNFHDSYKYELLREDWKA